jgi:hypothetical protein
MWVVEAFRGSCGIVSLIALLWMWPQFPIAHTSHDDRMNTRCPAFPTQMGSREPWEQIMPVEPCAASYIQPAFETSVKDGGLLKRLVQ